ncbi:MAG: carbohydrate ABC transporter permease, partial [Hungatella sp.]
MRTTKKKTFIGDAAIYLLLILWSLTTIYPIFWVIANSFKAKGEILANSFSLPLGKLFTLANYQTAFERLNIFSAYRNSMLISCTVAAVVILLAGMASFALVRYNFRLKKPLNSLVVAGMMFPVFSTIIPV